MADNVLRNDVVQISFDTDLKTLTAIIDGLDDLKKAVSDVGKEDGLERAKEEAEGVKNETEKATKSTEKLGKVDLSKLTGGLEKVADKIIEIAKQAGGAAFNAVKKVASISFKALTAGIGAAAAATGVLIKQAVDAYGDYEQLVGGVETLFKDSSGTVQKYADNAFKTAGLSANDYMETVTSFSASLLQSLNNDTAKSAEVADMAITDMADNANKMGTPMESIQVAYQGFAKQNYTIKLMSVA